MEENEGNQMKYPKSWVGKHKNTEKADQLLPLDFMTPKQRILVIK